MSLIDSLPEVRGSYRENYDLSKVNWFRVGGAAEVLFRPVDVDDLQHFLKHKPDDMSVNIMGVGSNILIRDGGLDGVIIRLGRSFSEITIKDDLVEVGAAALSLNVAKLCQNYGVAGLEFLSGIPGSIGGALAMNAGSYGSETADIFIEAEAIDEKGNLHKLTKEDFGFSYRSNQIADNWVFTKAVFRGVKSSCDEVKKKMDEISNKRENTQPIRTRTGGSTFANPSEYKAWQLIDQAGCRGMMVGGAKMSEQHCNFMINTGDATAGDLETLGERVRQKVKEKSGVDLSWEIKRIGKAG